ncbi:membrane protein DedA with SNARE-associated domain [Novosphingobium sp. PhB55]|uniref:DedA family protein n=1 Tax=Novosphingobium sp. PhB55 TaxID=2485106 RepID=UPI0010666393|nr:DedA family protein [Novosphingobium sp. PhB55]TDW68463.1 membrane protein DedA with SNARE-associated domain [Novosphingobium sp. PhB55]
MNEWVISLIEGGGYAGILLLMMLENIVPPIPSELIMGVAGIAIAHGRMDFLSVLLAGTVGSTLGNYVLFLGADRLGYERLKPFIERWGRWLTLEWYEVERAGTFFRKHGHWVVFLLRFMPMFRTMVSVPAGLAHMRHGTFLLYTAAGVAIWNTLLILAGRWLGQRFAQAEAWIGWATLVLAAGGAVWYLWRILSWKPSAERRSK